MAERLDRHLDEAAAHCASYSSSAGGASHELVTTIGATAYLFQLMFSRSRLTIAFSVVSWKVAMSDTSTRVRRLNNTRDLVRDLVRDLCTARTRHPARAYGCKKCLDLSLI